MEKEYLKMSDFNSKGFEVRGKRDKFWFTRSNEDSTLWMFKGNHLNGVTNEDIGEVVYYKICKQLGVSCSEYRLCNLVNDKNEYVSGVITKCYKTPAQDEISGYSVLEVVKNYIYDNYNGKGFRTQNTLIDYYNALGFAKMHLTEIDSLDLNSIMQELQAIALLDTVCCQSDRHWYNLTFLYDSTANKTTLAPTYDNGNCFFLNIGINKTQNINKMLTDSRNPIKALRQVIQDPPLLGIFTPTIKQDGTAVRPVKADGVYDTYMAELASIINASPNLKKLFEDIKQKVNIDQIFDEIGNVNPNIDFIRNHVKIVFNLQTKNLDKYVGKDKFENQEPDNQTGGRKL